MALDDYVGAAQQRAQRRTDYAADEFKRRIAIGLKCESEAQTLLAEFVQRARHVTEPLAIGAWHGGGTNGCDWKHLGVTGWLVSTFVVAVDGRAFRTAWGADLNSRTRRSRKEGRRGLPRGRTVISINQAFGRYESGEGLTVLEPMDWGWVAEMTRIRKAKGDGWMEGGRNWSIQPFHPQVHTVKGPVDLGQVLAEWLINNTHTHHPRRWGVQAPG